MASLDLNHPTYELDKNIVEIERDIGVSTDQYVPKFQPPSNIKRRVCFSSQVMTNSDSSNIFSLAFKREHGHSRNPQSVLDIPALRMKTLTISNSFKTVDDELLVSDCEFIRGGVDGKSVVGLWTSDQYNSIMYKLQFELSSQCSKNPDDMPAVVTKCFKKGPFFTKTRVVDLCDTFYNRVSCVLYTGVRNTIGTNMEGISVFCSYTTTPPAMGNLLLACRELYCCAGNRDGDIFAMGSERGVYVFGRDRLINISDYHETITSAEFSKSAQMLFCGTKTSALAMVDLRIPSLNTVAPNIMDLCETGVSETKLLSGENYIIVSGHDGTLSKIDLRAQKVVSRFFGHVGNKRKIPFNVSESLNMLCATGSDNTTRIWSLDSGSLLCTIRPHYPRHKASSFLVCNNDKWAIAIFQKDKMYTVEPSL